jgi:hypothetical protein
LFHREESLIYLGTTVDSLCRACMAELSLTRWPYFARSTTAVKLPSRLAARPSSCTASCRAGIVTRTAMCRYAVVSRRTPRPTRKPADFQECHRGATTLPASAAASANGHHLRISDDVLSLTWMCRCFDTLNQHQLRLINLNETQILVYYSVMALHLFGNRAYLVEIIILPYSRALLRLSHPLNVMLSLIQSHQG